MRHKNHGDCSHALEEDASKVLGRGFILKWAVGAIMVRGLGEAIKLAGTIFKVGIQYVLRAGGETTTNIY